MRTAICLVLWFATNSAVYGAARVDGFNLIRTVRSGRTTFDYSYNLQLQVDAQSYTGATVTVSSTSAATQVIQNTVNVGALDAGTSVRTASTFTIRQDRTVPFDPNALAFTFNGTSTGSADPADLRITTVNFLENGGRPGHEGVFAIQGDNPDAGASLVLHAAVYNGDSPEVLFRLLNAATGAILSSGSLIQPQRGGAFEDFFAAVTVPAVPFKIALSVFDDVNDPNGLGRAASWQSSKIYVPRPFSMRLAANSSIVTPGQTFSLTLAISSATASGDYTFSLTLPAGFNGATGPWVVKLAPGATVAIPTQITVAPTVNDFSRYTVSVGASPVGSTVTQYSDLAVLVE